MPARIVAPHRDASLRATGPKDPRLPRGKDFNGKPFGNLHYAQVRGDVFVGGASPTDVGQGNLGDCFFLSSLVAVANTHPDVLKQAIAKNPDGTFTVTFKQKAPGGEKSVPITIDGDFPARLGGKQTFGKGLQKNADGPELWPALFEKAYAAFTGGYSTINQGGYADEALAALTGKKASRLTLAAQSPGKLWDTLCAATKAHQPVVTGTPSAAQLRRLTGRADMDGLLDDHAYALLGVHEKNGARYVELYTPLSPTEGGNPAGGQQRTRTLPFDEYRRLFDDLVIGEV